MATDFTHDSAEYRANLVNGIATFSLATEILVGTVDSSETQYIPVAVQPFKTVDDGTRTTFVDEEDAIAWFKETR
jgi:hypothetical protein